MRWWVALGVVGCTADTAGQGPTFGHAGQWSPAARVADEVGVLAAHPTDLEPIGCTAPLCIAGRTAWRADGTLLLALGIEGVAEPVPADLSLVLDASCSVEGSTDVRDAAAEIALDHLSTSDTLRLSAFRATPVELLPPTAMDEGGRAEAWRALRALEALPVVEELIGLARELGADGCEDPDGAAELLGESEDPEVLELIEEVLALDELLDPLVELACGDGTDVPAAVDDGLASLPEGTASRASRLIVVSDLDGGVGAEASVDLAAEDFVGTTLLGITPSTDDGAGRVLASAPGALFLDAADPADALYAWDARFDALRSPTSFGLVPEITRGHGWSALAVLGATDRDGRGANATFASRDAGVMAMVLTTSEQEPGPIPVEVTVHRPAGDERVRFQVQPPVGLLEVRGHRSDSVQALRVALLLDLAEAVRDGGDVAGIERDLADLEARNTAADQDR
ncbi:MAG: hypothetical protein H6738_18660 [Alphaproteobacteria bacterium]|nr:hypothetical protein [Alphaproteobacteria bacterium]